MPQEFRVLLCYKCDTFQIDIIKKSKIWTCKLCGEKQTNKRVFGIGTSKDCRIHVQNLNKRKDLKDSKCLADMNENGAIRHIVHSDISTNLDFEKCVRRTENESNLIVVNKWSKFLDDSNCQTFQSEDQSTDERHALDLTRNDLSLGKFKSNKCFNNQDVTFDKRNARLERYDNISSTTQTVNGTDSLFEGSNGHCSPSRDFNTFDLTSNNKWSKYLDENNEESNSASEENYFDKNTKSRIEYSETKPNAVFSNSGIFKCERENKGESEKYNIKNNVQDLSHDNYKTACIENKAHRPACITMDSIHFLKDGTEISNRHPKKMFFDLSDHCDLDEIFKM